MEHFTVSGLWTWVVDGATYGASYGAYTASYGSYTASYGTYTASYVAYTAYMGQMGRNLRQHGNSAR